jgi:hypothetical protein
MKNSTVLTILSVALLLMAYIAFVDGKFMSTDEKKARAENVFSSLRADLIDRIELETSGGKVVLEAGDADIGEETVWRITHPTPLKTDPTEVQALISSLDFLIYQRVVKENPADARFGFSSPRVKGVVHFRGKQIVFRIGADAPGGEGVYVSTDDAEDRFFVVSTDFLDATNKTVNDLRDKHFVDINADDITAVRIQNGDTTIDATREAESGEWQIHRRDAVILGAASEFKQLIGAIADLKVTRFVSDTATNDQSFGTRKSKQSVSLTTSDGQKTTVTLGNDCDSDAVYAAVSGQSAIHCVRNTIRTMLQKSQERYFEKHLLSTSPDDIESLALKNSARETILRKKDGSWQVSGLDAADVSQTEFSAFFDALKKSRAEKIIFTPVTDNEDAGEMDSESVPLPSSDASPILTATIHRTEGTKQSLSVFGEPGHPRTVYMRRDGYAGWLLFSGDIVSMLTPHAQRFRRKELERCHGEDVLNMNIESNGHHQSIAKTDNTWRIDTPVKAEADKGNVDKLLELMCHTPVTAYPMVDDDPFGDKKMFAVITTTYTEHVEDDNTRDDTATGKLVMEIGAAHDSNSRFARFKDRPDLIFTVDNQYTTFLNTPVAARNLLAIQSDNITRVVFESDDVSFTASKKDGRWHADECPVNSDALDRLVIDFGAVKAIEAHSFNTRFATQTARIEFYGHPGDPPAELRFGEVIPENDGIVAARQDLGISFVLPARLIRDMKAACTPAQ